MLPHIENVDVLWDKFYWYSNPTQSFQLVHIKLILNGIQLESEKYIQWFVKGLNLQSSSQGV